MRDEETFQRVRQGTCQENSGKIAHTAQKKTKDKHCKVPQMHVSELKTRENKRERVRGKES